MLTDVSNTLRQIYTVYSPNFDDVLLADNIACRIVYNISKFDSTCTISTGYQLSLYNECLIQGALLTYRAYNGISPACLCDLVKPFVPGR